jgi:glycine/D-amino acid oxidase-like deaminating enzyme
MDLTSPRPYWPLKNGILRRYPSLKNDLRCEVAVVGAGITGALVADHLVRAGFDVVVLDKREAAMGSTSASTALLQYELDVHLVDLKEMIGEADAEDAYRVCLEGISKIEHLVNGLGDDCGFRRKKSVYLAGEPGEVGALQAEFFARRRAGIEVDLLSENEVASLFSFSRPAALLSHQAAEVDAYRLAHRLLERAQQEGARIFDRTPVLSQQSHEKGVTLATPHGQVEARTVVFATGYEAGEFLPTDIVNLKSSFALASEPLESFEGWYEQCLLWEIARPYLYLRTTSDGRAMIGGEDDPFKNAERRDALVPEKTLVLAERFRKMFPKIKMEVACAWAGTFGETKDGLAYIGHVRQLPNCFFTLGFGGNGIVFSVVAAEIIRDALLQRPNGASRLFRFDR